MLINLPEDSLSIREPFILPGLLMTNTNGRKLCLLFPDPGPSLCMLLCYPTLICLHMTDELLTLPCRPEFDTAKVEVSKRKA